MQEEEELWKENIKIDVAGCPTGGEIHNFGNLKEE